MTTLQNDHPMTAEERAAWRKNLSDRRRRLEDLRHTVDEIEAELAEEEAEWAASLPVVSPAS
jgi:antitoxin component of MazEF toxin-antitoxin module